MQLGQKHHQLTCLVGLLTQDKRQFNKWHTPVRFTLDGFYNMCIHTEEDDCHRKTCVHCFILLVDELGNSCNFCCDQCSILTSLERRLKGAVEASLNGLRQSICPTITWTLQSLTEDLSAKVLRDSVL